MVRVNPTTYKFEQSENFGQECLIGYKYGSFLKVGLAAPVGEASVKSCSDEEMKEESITPEETDEQRRRRTNLEMLD